MMLVKIRNNDTQLRNEEPRVPGRYFLPSLAMASFAMSPAMILLALLLLDIAQTFNHPVGITGQIETVSLTVAAITALLMGAWSIRYNNKSLLLLGLNFLSIAAVGCFLASNFMMLLLFYALTGLGYTMVQPMTYTLVGAHLSTEKRTNAIGRLNGSMASAYVIGPIIIGVLAGFGNWRLPFLGFALPVSVLSFVMIVKGVPSPTRGSHPTKSTGQYIEGFKGVFTNRSAVTCLIGIALLFVGWQGPLIYSPSFFREYYQISTSFASLLLTGFAISYVLGSLVISRFVNRFGRKILTVVTASIAGCFFIAFTNVFYFWLSVTFLYLGGLFFGMVVTTSTSLTLEQVPRFQGTMMSLHSAAWNMGAALGTGIGGLVLVLWNYEFLGLFLGVFVVTAAILFYLWVSDPTTT